jgi:uncharacterized protein YggE
MSDPQVVVRGTAVLSVEPEYADVHVTASATARDRQTALERCSAQQAAVDRVVAEAGDVVESAETTGVTVHVPWRARGPGDPTASVLSRLTVVRLQAVGDLVVALGSLDGVQVSGPHWRLRDDSPTYEQARLAAVTDAVRRARQYAAAFGAELTGLIQITDEGLSSRGMEMVGAATRIGSIGDDGGGPGLDLTPARQDVHGAVEVRFAISPPDPEVFRR